jgi:hypothetical protein
MKPKLKATGTKRLKLEHDEPLSSSGFKFNLRRYMEVLFLTRFMLPDSLRRWRWSGARAYTRSHYSST